MIGISFWLAMLGGGGSATVKNVFDASAYGASGNARKLTDAVLTNSSTTVTSATGNFTSADVGKVVFGTSDADHLLRLPVGTVLTVNSTTSITVSIAATTTQSSIWLVLGSDDTDAIRAACAAAVAVRGTLWVPSGGYIVKKVPFDVRASLGRVSIEGAGSGGTIFYQHPDFDLSTSVVNGGTMLLDNGNCERTIVRGVAFDGLSYSGVPFGTDSNAPFQLAGFRTIFDDVRIEKFYGANGAVGITGGEARFYNAHVEGNGVNNIIVGAGGALTAFNSYTGNQLTGASLLLYTITGEDNYNSYVRWIGGIIDEGFGGVASAVVQSSKDVTFIGARIYAGGGAFALDVQATSSKVTAIGCQIIPWGTTENRSGLKVAAGCQVRLADCRLGKAGTGVSINNAGTIIDAGGNEWAVADITGTRPLTIPSNLPTADPVVAGALWNNSGVVNISAG